jgi:sporulation protein YlmC with PRC-barrel domain
MLKTLTAAVLAAIVVLPAAVASAADEIKPHPGGLIQAEWLTGRPVVDAGGKEMGKIEEVWFDPKEGRVKEVIIGAGGFLGIGEKQSVLPWKDVRIVWKNEKPVVETNEQTLRAAETRERGRQPSASPR